MYQGPTSVGPTAKNESGFSPCVLPFEVHDTKLQAESAVDAKNLSCNKVRSRGEEQHRGRHFLRRCRSVRMGVFAAKCS